MSNVDCRYRWGGGPDFGLSSIEYRYGGSLMDVFLSSRGRRLLSSFGHARSITVVLFRLLLGAGGRVLIVSSKFFFYVRLFFAR